MLRKHIFYCFLRAHSFAQLKKIKQKLKFYRYHNTVYVLKANMCILLMKHELRCVFLLLLFVFKKKIVIKYFVQCIKNSTHVNVFILKSRITVQFTNVPKINW